MNKINLILALSLLSNPLFSYAQSQEIAEENAKKILHHRMNMKEPTNDIERWERDIWLFSAISCYRAAKLPLPNYLNKTRVYANGTFSLPRDLNSYCQNLSDGPKLNCFNINSTQPPFGMPLPTLYREYLYIEKGQKVQNNTQFMAGGDCYLSEKSTHKDQQFFAGKATIQWSQELSPKNIAGQNVIAGNASIIIPGLGSFPKIVIQK